jgi:hypothetical protein
LAAPDENSTLATRMEAESCTVCTGNDAIGIRPARVASVPARAFRVCPALSVDALSELLAAFLSPAAAAFGRGLSGGVAAALGTTPELPGTTGPAEGAAFLEASASVSLKLEPEALEAELAEEDCACTEDVARLDDDVTFGASLTIRTLSLQALQKPKPEPAIFFLKSPINLLDSTPCGATPGAG